MKYRNEEDKCYGITGMAIGITIWNGEDMLYKLDLTTRPANTCSSLPTTILAEIPVFPLKNPGTTR